MDNWTLTLDSLKEMLKDIGIKVISEGANTATYIEDLSANSLMHRSYTIDAERNSVIFKGICPANFSISPQKFSEAKDFIRNHNRATLLTANLTYSNKLYIESRIEKLETKNSRELFIDALKFSNRISENFLNEAKKFCID